MWYINDVQDMYIKFGFDIPKTPTPMNVDEAKKRVAFIQEELNELNKAIDENDMHEVLDALVDIVVVTVGTSLLYGMGGIYDAAWDRVHRSNMQKEVITDGTSKRGMKRDLRKPAGWKAPDFTDLLKGIEDGKC